MMSSTPRGSRDRNPWWLVLDPILILSTVAVTAIGIVLVYSATRGPANVMIPADRSFLERQMFFALLGGILAVVAALFDVRRLRALIPAGYAGLMALLVAVLVLGVKVSGARAWFRMAGFTFQPSEPGKIILILVLARVLSVTTITTTRLTVALGLSLLPIALILKQPDLGTVLVYLAIIAAVVVVSNVPTRVIFLLAIIALTAVVGIFRSSVLANYQEARLTVFLLDDAALAKLDPSVADYAYNAKQSQVAIGNGGLTGQGLFQGTQTSSNLVPKQQTDFIFSVAGEELGFRGAAVILLLYLLIVFRIWRTAVRAPDPFDRLLSIGVVAMLMFQIFQSVGMTTGIMPVTGIPLPFLSYGGSSMITSMTAIGLVLGVHRRRFDYVRR